ncbi:MAG: hypothetical protein A3F13_02525 [Gammaproteobacteria bacterium RIFCSPHIGHO2_12_FULL_40_19]|nr:MAG: hypothetical protein A3F13_02525 [Gammaproteobacteria bacterium RIFCSPHIGHO2_12_FULL_40_19]
MSSAEQMIEDVFMTWSEHLEHMEEKQMYNFMINALAVTAVRERDKAECYKMALKRCEIMKR